MTQTDTLFAAINETYREDETTCINKLLGQATFSTDALERIHNRAIQLVEKTRQNRKKQGGLDSFLHQYDLSSEEGIALMCLAEALLRIPDTETIDRLISDKLSSADWYQHLNTSDSLFVNAATWSLMLTGKLYAPTLDNEKTLGSSLKRLLSRTSSTMIRPLILQSMKIIGKQFVMGRTIDEALNRAKKLEAKGYRYSYDMLGEAARTAEDAEKYFLSYETAIAAIGNAANQLGPVNGPGISIKLSALHPRYEYSQRERVLNELTPRLLTLVKQAKHYNIGLTIDAEEADRLELSLSLFKLLFTHSDLEGWDGLGLAVQAYQKRAPAVLDWLISLSRQQQRRIMVRLVKGAYWDAEIKQSQQLGLEGYPVFTRKNATDVSYLACAKKILTHPECFFAQFGTHNAYSVAAIMELAVENSHFEFQCLHGMGQPLYDHIVQDGFNMACRIYAPVGSHKELLGYLVRRLLENGANTSFINRIADEKTPPEVLVADPVDRMFHLAKKPHPHIPLPQNLFLPDRLNSRGIDLSNSSTVRQLFNEMTKAEKKPWIAAPIIDGETYAQQKTARTIVSPALKDKIVGHVTEATLEQADKALQSATQAARLWADTAVNERAACLDRAANLFEKWMPKFIAMLCREGGKCIPDCISEVREAIDFCRYYAERARQDLLPQTLTSPTGESNQLSLHPRGLMICISPWNFPLAIFIGQITAALVTGNPVIAKPAEQTPLIAAAAIQLLHEAGIPKNVLHFLPGTGETIGAHLVADPRVAGVIFTGSTDTAKLIQQTLANRPGPLALLIAETGGQNAMIVDSSALPEQVVADVIQSGFNSAGQRCSALRVLYLQTDIASQVIEMLKGALAEIKLGNPSLISTDVGPVIDVDALSALNKHADNMRQKARFIAEAKPIESTGHFFAPCLFELDNLKLLTREVFGPIVHVIRYKANELDKVLDDIIQTGYGLTLGIHSRISSTVEYITNRMPVGNCYVNRNMVGAVVGVQPFGGERLSGTGPKAGGPHYLPRLCIERTLSINTTAAGGNTTLVSLSEEGF